MIKTDETKIIEKIANFWGYEWNEVKDYFLESCKDENCPYYRSGHLWALTKDSDNYKDWSYEYNRMAIKDQNEN